MKKIMLRKQDLVYPQLSYSVIGVLFDVYNNLGIGHKEQYYQKAIALALRTAGLAFKEQVYVPLLFKGEKIGSCFLDFVIENKIVLEIKSGDRFYRQNIDQIHSYLKAGKLKLGILANFTRTGLQFKRIINIR